MAINNTSAQQNTIQQLSGNNPIKSNQKGINPFLADFSHPAINNIGYSYVPGGPSYPYVPGGPSYPYRWDSPSLSYSWDRFLSSYADPIYSSGLGSQYGGTGTTTTTTTPQQLQPGERGIFGTLFNQQWTF